MQPAKVLGIYTFTKRVALEEMESKPRKQQGYSTVSHFNIVHYDCHLAAVRWACFLRGAPTGLPLCSSVPDRALQGSRQLAGGPGLGGGGAASPEVFILSLTLCAVGCPAFSHIGPRTIPGKMHLAFGPGLVRAVLPNGGCGPSVYHLVVTSGCPSVESVVTHWSLLSSQSRLARGREEWESAALQNANTKCNGLLPVWGPHVPESAFATCLARCVWSRGRGGEAGVGLPWWSSGEALCFHRQGHVFRPWLGCMVWPKKGGGGFPGGGGRSAIGSAPSLEIHVHPRLLTGAAWSRSDSAGRTLHPQLLGPREESLAFCCLPFFADLRIQDTGPLIDPRGQNFPELTSRSSEF